MSLPSASARTARVVHRYVGFFLAGIMAVYAVSGTVLIFRKTDFLKVETAHAATVEPGLTAEALGKEIEVRRLAFERTEGPIVYFDDGAYDLATGEVTWTTKALPPVLAKMTHLHKATSDDPLYVLNVAFGVALLGFVVTAFWMYMPGGTVLRRGLYFAAAGVALTVALLWRA